MSFHYGGTDRPGRVVVGVAATLAGLQALRLAVGEARRRGTELHAVRAWGQGPVEPPAQTPSVTAAGLAGPLGLGSAATPPDATEARRGALAAEAEALIARAFAETLGGPPTDLSVHVVPQPDTPGRVLVEYACREDDLLVIGSGARSRLRRPRGSPVVRYCLRHAGCPVLVVPPPPLTRAGSPRALRRQLRRELDHLPEPPTDR